ncbi:MAG TPA: PaaI family thioesterase [Vicinamibacteria bacterium]
MPTPPEPNAPELLQRMLRGEVPPPPVARLVGFELIEAGNERALFRLAVDERHTNPMGTLHGGILCDVADAAMGCAMATTLRPGQSYTTLELAITFLKPVWKTTLTARGWVVKRTRKLGLAECEVLDEKGSLVAKAKSTCLVLEGEEAVGR